MTDTVTSALVLPETLDREPVGSLVEVQLVGGAGEVPVAGDGLDAPQLSDVHDGDR